MKNYGDENDRDSADNNSAKYDKKDVRINSLKVYKKTDIDNYFKISSKISMRMSIR